MNVKVILIIGCGGFVGAVSRYLVSGWVQTFFKHPFPYGTLAVNCIGSLLLGILAGLTQKALLSPEWRLFLSIGLMGAFTTFSTFSYETMMLLRNQSYGEAFLNVSVSVVLGLVLVYAGYLTGQTIHF